jgi:hypothetical protein
MYENTTTFANINKKKESSYYGINPNYYDQSPKSKGTPCFGRTTMGCENNYIRSPQG